MFEDIESSRKTSSTNTSVTRQLSQKYFKYCYYIRLCAVLHSYQRRVFKKHPKSDARFAHLYFKRNDFKTGQVNPATKAALRTIQKTVLLGQSVSKASGKDLVRQSCNNASVFLLKAFGKNLKGLCAPMMMLYYMPEIINILKSFSWQSRGLIVSRYSGTYYNFWSSNW